MQEFDTLTKLNGMLGLVSEVLFSLALPSIFGPLCMFTLPVLCL